MDVDSDPRGSATKKEHSLSQSDDEPNCLDLSSKTSPARKDKQEVNKNPSEEHVEDKTRHSTSKKIELSSSCKEIIKQLFHVDMPDDFYSFWEMCKKINNSDPASKCLCCNIM